MSSIGAIPSHMITIVFACMMLGVKKSENTSSMMHDAAAGLGWLWSNSFMQVGVACLLCAFLFTPVFGVNELFGSLFEIGFAGGHGTAGGMASVFTDSFNWADGADLGKTTATIGLLAGIFGGMAIINIAVRKSGPRSSPSLLPATPRRKFLTRATPTTSLPLMPPSARTSWSPLHSTSASSALLS